MSIPLIPHSMFTPVLPGLRYSFEQDSSGSEYTEWGTSGREEEWHALVGCSQCLWLGEDGGYDSEMAWGYWDDFQVRLMLVVDSWRRRGGHDV